MNIQKCTQKSIEAVQDCEKIAVEYGNQEIEQEHLLYALMTIEDSLIAKLVERMGVDNRSFLMRIEEGIKKRTKVSGGHPYIGAELNKALLSADAFGTFGALDGGIFADEYDFERDFLDSARRYYSNI